MNKAVRGDLRSGSIFVSIVNLSRRHKSQDNWAWSQVSKRRRFFLGMAKFFKETEILRQKCCFWTYLIFLSRSSSFWLKVMQAIDWIDQVNLLPCAWIPTPPPPPPFRPVSTIFWSRQNRPSFLSDYELQPHTRKGHLWTHFCLAAKSLHSSTKLFFKPWSSGNQCPLNK